MYARSQTSHITIDSCSCSCCAHTCRNTHIQAAKRHSLWRLRSLCTLCHPQLVLENARTASQVAAVAAHSERPLSAWGDDCKPTLWIWPQRNASLLAPNCTHDLIMIIFPATSQKPLKILKFYISNLIQDGFHPACCAKSSSWTDTSIFLLICYLRTALLLDFLQLIQPLDLKCACQGKSLRLVCSLCFCCLGCQGDGAAPQDARQFLWPGCSNQWQSAESRCGSFMSGKRWSRQ